MTADLAIVAELEAVAARAVPSASTDDVGGWRLRHTPGLSTKRANSVLAVSHEAGTALEPKLAAVEAFYAEHALPARFQLTPVSKPSGLAEILSERGYQPAAPTAVLHAELANRGEAPAALPVETERRPGASWWSVWRATLGVDAARGAAVAALFERIPAESAFAVVAVGGEPAAVALGVRDGRWLGIFNMATRPAARRRGAGRAAIATLSDWGRRRGAHRAYLQVDLDNAGALSLYRGIGFRELYRYVYYAQPDEAAPPVSPGG